MKKEWTVIAPGIRRDQFGQHEVRAKARGATRYMPAALVRSSDLAAMQRWQAAEEKNMRAVDRLDARPAREARGTLEADVARFLPQIAGRVSFKADRSHARAWLAEAGRDPRRPLGLMHRAAITHEDLNIITARWQQAPTARAVRRIRVAAYARCPKARIICAEKDTPSTIAAYERQTPVTSGQAVAARTIIHRLRVLDELYRTLDPTAATTPCDAAKWPKKPTGTIPPTVSLDIILATAQRLAADDPATYARYLILNATAQRPCQLQRAQAADVDLRARLWYVRNAKGAPGHPMHLSEDACAAWRLFIAAEAWGWYDTTKHARKVHAAGWPAAIRPYAARHSLIQAALAEGVPLTECQGLAGHASPTTTQQFYGPLAIPAQRAVAEKVDGRLATLFRPTALKGGRRGTKNVPRGTSALRAVPAKPKAAPRRPARSLPPVHTTRAAGKGRK